MPECKFNGMVPQPLLYLYLAVMTAGEALFACVYNDVRNFVTACICQQHYSKMITVVITKLTVYTVP